MSEGFGIENITAGVLVNVIYGTMIGAIRLSRKALDRANPAARRFVLALLVLTTIAGNVVIYYTSGRLFPIFSSALLLIAFFMLWSQLRQFWDIGLIGADRTIRGGLDYTRSLKMCNNSLSFLGIGASKLTEHAADFEGAMQRCNRPMQPIRLLLCKPDSKILQMAAQNANRPQDEYSHRVQESLRTIADYRNRRLWNIEVRFYDLPRPLFRLMFVDDWLCLASHYVFGEGDGSELPQLHARRSATGRDVHSLYHPL